VKIEAVYFLLETVDPRTVLAMKASFFEFRSENPEQLLAQVKVKVTDVHALISF